MTDPGFVQLTGFEAYTEDEMRRRAREFYTEADRRRTVRDHSRLDDRLLRDLGLERAGIEAFASNLA